MPRTVPLPAVEADQAEQRPDHRRLAGAVGAEQAHRPLGHTHGEIVQRGQPTIGFGHAIELEKHPWWHSSGRIDSETAGEPNLPDGTRVRKERGPTLVGIFEFWTPRLTALQDLPRSGRRAPRSSQIGHPGGRGSRQAVGMGWGGSDRASPASPTDPGTNRSGIRGRVEFGQPRPRIHLGPGTGHVLWIFRSSL